MKKFNVGDKVKCNGNPEGRIIAMFHGSFEPMYVVRLWSGFRLVGEVCVSERDLNLEN